MMYFATYFDVNYLARALALYHSLARHCKAFHLFALCLDDDACKYVEDLHLSETTAITLEQLENACPELLRVKPGRTKTEYYYTCGPSFLVYLLCNFPEIDVITHLDADLFFFSDPKPLLTELMESSVGIIEHRFTKRLQKLRRFGIYNVGWVSFRRDDHGLACLRWWAESCLEWCYDRVEGARFADQRYLDEFPNRFSSVHVIQHLGANVAPWNIGGHQLIERQNQIFVDNYPLIFFHFQGLRMITRWLFDTNLGWYHTAPSATIRRKIFGPYIQQLKHFGARVGPAHSRRSNDRGSSRGFGTFVRGVRRGAQISHGILGRAYIVVLSETVL